MKHEERVTDAALGRNVGWAIRGEANERQLIAAAQRSYSFRQSNRPTIVRGGAVVGRRADRPGNLRSTELALAAHTAQ